MQKINEEKTKEKTYVKCAAKNSDISGKEIHVLSFEDIGNYL